MSTSNKLLYGFHAVGVRLKTAAPSILELHIDVTRRDARMKQFQERAKETAAATPGLKLIESDGARLTRMCGGMMHQGVVAVVNPLIQARSVDDVLDQLEASSTPQTPLILVLDGVTDPHNLGACLRVADGAGAHAVIAPKDHAVGAAETMPYLMVTNLARTLGELKERNIWVIGTSEDAEKTIHEIDLKGPVALVLGAEGPGMRALTKKTCDELVRIPMLGAVESLNVSVASAVCLYEAVRQRSV
jgi:23S rRNA (guanosine2251-2'-O)-methyltransferase